MVGISNPDAAHQAYVTHVVIHKIQFSEAKSETKNEKEGKSKSQEHQNVELVNTIFRGVVLVILKSGEHIQDTMCEECEV